MKVKTAIEYERQLHNMDTALSRVKATILELKGEVDSMPKPDGVTQDSKAVDPEGQLPTLCQSLVLGIEELNDLVESLRGAIRGTKENLDRLNVELPKEG